MVGAAAHLSKPKATEMCTVITERADKNIFDLGLHNITDTEKKKKKYIPLTHVVFHGNPSCCFIGGVLDERTGFTGL